MANFYNALPAKELTEFTRLLLAAEDFPQNQGSLRRWFPPELNETIKYRFRTGTNRSYTAAAPFRGFDTPSPIGTRPGRGRVEGQLAPISMQFPLRELDILEQQAMERAGAEFAEMLRGDVYDDVEAGMRAIMNRFELVYRDFLVSGLAVINDRNLQLVIDPGRSAGRASTVAIGWGTNPTTAVPITNERAVVSTMKNGEGMSASDLVVLTNEATWAKWCATTQVRDAYQSNRTLGILSEEQGRQVRRELSLPDVEIIDRIIAPLSGVPEQLIPDNYWLYVPKTQAIGTTQFGVPAMASNPKLDIVRDDRPGPLAYQTIEEGEPYGITTHVQALGVPVMQDPDSTYALDVEP